MLKAIREIRVSKALKEISERLALRVRLAQQARKEIKVIKAIRVMLSPMKTLLPNS